MAVLLPRRTKLFNRRGERGGGARHWTAWGEKHATSHYTKKAGWIMLQDKKSCVTRKKILRVTSRDVAECKNDWKTSTLYRYKNNADDSFTAKDRQISPNFPVSSAAIGKKRRGIHIFQLRHRKLPLLTPQSLEMAQIWTFQANRIDSSWTYYKKTFQVQEGTQPKWLLCIKIGMVF